jgi:uncharacterized protein (TIGR02246 family)
MGLVSWVGVRITRIASGRVFAFAHSRQAWQPILLIRVLQNIRLPLATGLKNDLMSNLSGAGYSPPDSLIIWIGKGLTMNGGMARVWVAVVALIGAGFESAAQGQSAAPAATPPAAAVAAQPAAPAALSALEAAIVRESEATVKSFNTADATAMAGHFLEKGELVDENGNVYEGRAQIAELFKNFFTKFPKAVIEMQVTSVRPVGDGLAVEEGERRITAENGAATAQLHYMALRSKQGDRWQIASYREFIDDPKPTAQEMLMPASWLVGDWIDESPEGRSEISFKWSEDGNFLLGQYTLSEGGQVTSKSVQRIGWDPVEQMLRSWTFDSDGGFSTGEWAQVDDGWVVKSEATMPDGTTGSATMTITIKDEDHFLVRSTDRIIAGVEEPDFEMQVARKPPQPAK